MIIDKYIELSGGCILDDNTVLLKSSDGHLRYDAKHTEFSIWSSDESKPVLESLIIKSFTKFLVRYKSPQDKFNGACVLSDNEEIIFIQGNTFWKERIKGVRENSELNSLSVIDGSLWVCGDDGVVYRRVKKNQWISVDDAIKLKYTFVDLVRKSEEYTEKRKIENISLVDSIIEWETSEKFKYTDHRRLWRICGNRQDNIYACGSVNTNKSKDGLLFHFNGLEWKEIDIPQTTTLCAIYVDDKITLVGGQDGHILESLDGEFFRDISRPKDLMTIGSFARYGVTIYIGSDQGLLQYAHDGITKPDISAYICDVDPDILTDSVSIDILGDYMLLITQYSAYRYCFKTKKCELLVKFTGHKTEVVNDEQ